MYVCNVCLLVCLEVYRSVGISDQMQNPAGKWYSMFKIDVPSFRGIFSAILLD